MASGGLACNCALEKRKKRCVYVCMYVCMYVWCMVYGVW